VKVLVHLETGCRALAERSHYCQQHTLNRGLHTTHNTGFSQHAAHSQENLELDVQNVINLA